MLNYKKPAFWVMTLTIVAIAIVAVCFMTNPKTYAENELDMNNYNDSVEKTEDDKAEDEDVFSNVGDELVFAYEHKERGCVYTVYLNTVDKSFKMSYGTDSYCKASGKYSIEGNKIIMQDADEPELYVFNYVDGHLSFCADESTEMPLYAVDLNESLNYILLGRTTDKNFDENAYEKYSNDSDYEIVRLINDGYVFRNDVFDEEELEIQLSFFRNSFKEGIVNWE